MYGKTQNCEVGVIPDAKECTGKERQYQIESKTYVNNKKNIEWRNTKWQ